MTLLCGLSECTEPLGDNLCIDGECSLCDAAYELLDPAEEDRGESPSVAPGLLFFHGWNPEESSCCWMGEDLCCFLLYGLNLEDSLWLLLDPMV